MKRPRSNNAVTEALNRGDQLLRYAAGAIHALVFGMLHEFSNAGNSGVVEIHVRDGQPAGVFVRKIEKDPPKNVRGTIAGWELTPTDLANVFLKRRLTSLTETRKRETPRFTANQARAISAAHDRPQQ